MDRNKAILNNELIFDRTCECDFCGEKKKVAICNYGTGYYVRTICKDCSSEIIEKHKVFNLSFPIWYSEGTIKEAKENCKGK